MKYEVLIYDADETLFDFKKSEKEAIKNTMIAFQIDYVESYHLNLYKEINSSIWNEFEKGLITQKTLKTERFKRLGAKLNIDLDEHKFAKSYMNHLAEGSFLFGDSRELIESLNDDYRQLIITNGLKDVQDKRIRKSVIAHHFETIIVSEEISVSKPDPKIFEYALERISHSDKSKVLVIGDSLTSDIQGGINFGVDTCWYNPKQIENKTGIEPTYEISNLMDLKRIIQN